MEGVPGGRPFAQKLIGGKYIARHEFGQSQPKRVAEVDPATMLRSRCHSIFGAQSGLHPFALYIAAPLMNRFRPSSLRHFRATLLAALAMSCASVLTAEALAKNRSPSRPNIVVILVDDLGYGDLSSFNEQSRIETPALAAFAQESMRLTDAHAPGPLCHMSRYGLMTGQYPYRVDVNRWRTNALIRPEQVTLASHLRTAGYHTAMVGKWHLGFEENGYDAPLPGGPVDVGFDEFFGIRASTDIPPYFYIRNDRAVDPPTDHIDANSSEGWSPIQGAFWRAGGISPELDLADVLPTFSDEAIGAIDRHVHERPQQPLFLYVALPAPHTPWLPSEIYEKASDVALYGDFVVMVDAVFSRIVDRLADHRIDDESLVVFTSDNGPVWYDEDVAKYGHDSAGELRGMKADAWEAGHRMPMIVRWPGHIAPGTQSDQLLCFTDLLATFADLTGVPLPPGAGPDSISFLPTLLQHPYEHSEPRTRWVMQSGRGYFVVRDQDWKWIDRLGSGGFSKPNVVKPAIDGPTSQLYNLADDPGEQTNLAGQRSAKVAHMRAILESAK